MECNAPAEKIWRLLWIADEVDVRLHYRITRLKLSFEEADGPTVI
jgi:hypothetical protein